MNSVFELISKNGLYHGGKVECQPEVKSFVKAISVLRLKVTLDIYQSNEIAGLFKRLMRGCVQPTHHITWVLLLQLNNFLLYHSSTCRNKSCRLSILISRHISAKFPS